jgi:hypothetical protein
MSNRRGERHIVDYRVRVEGDGRYVLPRPWRVDPLQRVDTELTRPSTRHVRLPGDAAAEGLEVINEVIGNFGWSIIR